MKINRIDYPVKRVIKLGDNYPENLEYGDFIKRFATIGLNSWDRKPLYFNAFYHPTGLYLMVARKPVFRVIIDDKGNCMFKPYLKPRNPMRAGLHPSIHRLLRKIHGKPTRFKYTVIEPCPITPTPNPS